MPLIQRSYERQENFLDGKPFNYPSKFCTDSNIYKENNDLSSLTKSGQNLISGFISSNKKLEKFKMECEKIRRNFEIFSHNF